MTVDVRWQNLTRMADALKERVEKMARGGDLEGLIEEGLDEMDREVFKVLLEAREAAASVEAAAFSPSGLPAVRRANESGASQVPAGTDASGGVGIQAKRI